MNLESRLRKLEARKTGMAVVFADGCLDAEGKRTAVESYRREHGLPAETLIVVLDADDRMVL